MPDFCEDTPPDMRAETPLTDDEPSCEGLITDCMREPAHIDEQDVAYIEGKPHPMYRGLLKAARQQGLMSLEAVFTYNDAALSLATAKAVFADGRVYQESADATPTNVGKRLVPHFRRMALTRAKSRVLRDALGIGDASFEEFGAEPTAPESAPPVPIMTPAAMPSTAGTLNGVYATGLVADTLPDGRVLFKVTSADAGFPQNRRDGARYPGIPIYEQGFKASGLVLPTIDDPESFPDIRGWQVEWESFTTKAGKASERVLRVVRPHAGSPPAAASDDDDDDDDIPF